MVCLIIANFAHHICIFALIADKNVRYLTFSLDVPQTLYTVGGHYGDNDASTKR